MTPGRFDAEAVRRHLVAMDQALQTLRRHQDWSLADLSSDRDRAWVVERGLQLCAQNALDVATHIAASAGHDISDYAAAIDRLAEMTVLPTDFATRFRGVAGFRDILVHGYLELDLAIVHRLLRGDLDDFEVFARHVQRYLDARRSSS